MNSLQLLDRIEKVEERIAKREKTLDKYADNIAKLEAQAANAPDAQERRFNEIDARNKRDDRNRLMNKIENDRATLAKYREQLERQETLEKTYRAALPDCMKELESQLSKAWYEWDIARRERLLSGDRDKRSRADWLFLEKSDETLKKENADDARRLVVELFYRVYNKTGNVTSWRGLSVSGNAINGVVTGESGTVRVESILAGGYNIQRLHVRVLVHEI